MTILNFIKTTVESCWFQMITRQTMPGRRR